MAKIRANGFEEVNRMLSRLAQPDAMAIKAVEAAVPVVEKNLKAQIRSAANRTDEHGRPYSTGELEQSIAATEASMNDLGAYSVIKPEGTDSKGLRNAEKLAYLEYGVRSHGQEPRPVRAAAVAKSEGEALKVMEAVIGAEVEKL